MKKAPAATGANRKAITMPSTRILPPPGILVGDSPRTRLTDPLTSHLAGDRSQTTIKAVADAVLVLIRQEETLTGSQLNELYALRADRYGWPLVHFDSPRKRAGELAADGILTVLNGDAARGTEHEYTLLEATA